MALRRLVVHFRGEEMVVRAPYGTQDGPKLGTKARIREVSRVVRTGLTQALESLEAGAERVGTSEFTTREDVLRLEWKGLAASVAKRRGSSRG